jgi:hypothetical protein
MLQFVVHHVSPKDGINWDIRRFHFETVVGRARLLCLLHLFWLFYLLRRNFS